MKLGILSDSHGRVAMVRSALNVLDAAGADAFIHCGDVGGLEVLEELAGRRCWYVWGNTDYPAPSWRSAVLSLGLPWPDGLTAVQIDGKSIGVFHGHESAYRAAMNEAIHDYLLHGHTHERDDYRVGTMRVINPGALHRASPKSVALLDVAADELTFLNAETAEQITDITR